MTVFIYKQFDPILKYNDKENVNFDSPFKIYTYLLDFFKIKVLNVFSVFFIKYSGHF